MNSLVKATPIGKCEGNLQKAQANKLLMLEAALCSALDSLYMRPGRYFARLPAKRAMSSPGIEGIGQKEGTRMVVLPCKVRPQLCPAFFHTSPTTFNEKAFRFFPSARILLPPAEAVASQCMRRQNCNLEQDGLINIGRYFLLKPLSSG